MSSSPFSIPETLSIILSFLDRCDILNVSTVSRAWHEAATRLLWKSLLRPSLSHGFYIQLQKNGCHVQRLELILDTKNRGYSVAPTELTRVLKYTPRLKSLSLRVSNGWIPNTVSALLIIIKDFVAGQLEHLELGIGSLQLDEAKDFFSALTSLKRLELRMYTTSGILRAISSSGTKQLKAFAYNPTMINLLSGNNPISFNDEALVSLSKSHGATLANLSIVMNSVLTSSGLVGFSERCKNLTRLRLSCCRGVASIGIEALIEASPSLTHVLLEYMNVSDMVFLKLTTTPARCAQLQVLSVLCCRGPSSIGVQNVVRSCQNLKELSIHCSPNVWMDIFEEPAWECTGLETLILRDLSRDGFAIVQGQENATDDLVDPDEPWTRSVTDIERSNMFRQIGRLWRLKELELVGFAFPLKLFELGRTDLDRLQRLCTLRLASLWTPIQIREMIWLATQFPRLQMLQLDEGTVSASLLKDLTDINKKLKMEFVAPRIRSAAPASSDSESGTEHENGGQGIHHFEFWSSDGDHEPWSPMDTDEGIPLGHSDDETEYNSPLDEYDSDLDNDDNGILDSDEGGYMSSLHDSMETEDYDAYDSDDYKSYSGYSFDNEDGPPSPCLSDDQILPDSVGSLIQSASDEELNSSLLHSDESDRYQYDDDDDDDLPAQNYSDDESILSYRASNLTDDDSDNQSIRSDGDDNEIKLAKPDTDDEEDIIGDDTENEDESIESNSDISDGPHRADTSESDSYGNDTSDEDEPTANDNDDKDKLLGDHIGSEDEPVVSDTGDEDMRTPTDTDDDSEPAWFGIKGEKQRSHSSSDSDGGPANDMADDDGNSTQDGSDYETRPEVDSSEDDRAVIRKDIGDEAASSADDDD
ncbi:hypothetical protein BG011_002289 [Mortierella polycephala]|uniref:F-box domain-containing protein n=1 Tax=Mortierella polycephala TaxID=41804 RepID=A0A9P6U489_9FUNG|nr:hypothetical protein BG011_002289 [Mortierella polycephala]